MSLKIAHRFQSTLADTMTLGLVVAVVSLITTVASHTAYAADKSPLTYSDGTYTITQVDHSKGTLKAGQVAYTIQEQGIEGVKEVLIGPSYEIPSNELLALEADNTVADVLANIPHITVDNDADFQEAFYDRHYDDHTAPVVIYHTPTLHKYSPGIAVMIEQLKLKHPGLKVIEYNIPVDKLDDQEKIDAFVKKHGIKKIPAARFGKKENAKIIDVPEFTMNGGFLKSNIRTIIDNYNIYSPAIPEYLNIK